MGLLQKLISGIGKHKEEYKEKFKQAEIEMKIAKTLEERSKSANQRELERYMKEQEEAKIKAELDKIHKKQNHDAWKSPNLILGQKTMVTKTDRPILKEKNIFIDKRNDIPLTKKKGMYFKW